MKTSKSLRPGWRRWSSGGNPALRLIVHRLLLWKLSLKVRDTKPAPVFFNINIQKSARVAGDCSLVIHGRRANPRHNTRVPMDVHFNIAVLERLEIQGPGLEVSQMLRFGKIS